MTNSEILNLKFYSEDLSKKVSIKQFFHILLKTVWIEQEEFDGKRPFGNSGWDGDLIKCLVQNKIIEGEIDEYGDPESYSTDSVNNKVIELINEIFKK